MDYALDTESDRFGDRSIENTRYVLLTICPPDATSLDDVKCFFDDESAWYPFMRFFEESNEDMNIEWFNGGYEHGAFWDAMIAMNYTFLSRSNFPPNCKKSDIVKAMRGTPHAVYMSIDKNAGFLEAIVSGPMTEYRSHDNSKKQRCRLMTIRDAAKIMGGKDRMCTMANAIRKEHPDWWSEGMNTKDEMPDEMYNNGWYYDKIGYEEFMHYSLQDAYSQAMIFRHLNMTDQAGGMSRSGNSWKKAILLCEDTDNQYFANIRFRKRYQPLKVPSQVLYEEGLLGGYVYGRTGDHENMVATKGDYKSSYPAGYWFMELPMGKEYRLTPDAEEYERVMTLEHTCRFILCEFDFRLKDEIHQPCINAYECLDEDGEKFTRHLNRKMKEGHRRLMLTPEPYIEAIKRHYDISNFIVKEIRYFKGDRDAHYYRPAIRRFFLDKETNRKGSVFYNEAKLNINGGMHGKNIQGIERQYREYDAHGLDKDRLWSEPQDIDELRESPYPFHVGMWVMMCRRACLLNDIADANDMGVRNLMADTDSMVLECNTEKFREIYGDKIADAEILELMKHLKWELMNDDEKDWFISQVLGKIDIEMEGIEHFKCWGLKRYLCDNGKEIGTAFAGMGDRGWFRGVKYDGGLQKAVLTMTPIDEELIWEQNILCTVPGLRHTRTVFRSMKHAKAEDIWFNDEIRELLWYQKQVKKATQNDLYQQSRARELYYELYEDLGPKGFVDEDVEAELKDKRYDEKDRNINRKGRKKKRIAYVKTKLEDYHGNR